MKNALLLMCQDPFLQQRPASCGSLPLFFETLTLTTVVSFCLLPFTPSTAMDYDVPPLEMIPFFSS